VLAGYLLPKLPERENKPARAGWRAAAAEAGKRERAGRPVLAGYPLPKPPGRENKPARAGWRAAASGAARKKRAGSPLADLLEEKASDDHAALTQQTATASPSGSP